MGVGRVGSIIGPTVGGVLVAMAPGWDTLFRIAAIPCAVAALAVGAGRLMMSRKPQLRADAVARAAHPQQ